MVLTVEVVEVVSEGELVDGGGMVMIVVKVHAGEERVVQVVRSGGSDHDMVIGYLFRSISFQICSKVW